MGAGARMAAERDRWPDHWRVADLEIEVEGVLDLLQSAEELVVVVPGMRSTPQDGESQVLIAVTDRRVVVVGRARIESLDLEVVDVTTCSSTAPRMTRRVPHDDGHLTFDVDDASMARIWARIDELHRNVVHSPERTLQTRSEPTLRT
jgi:hypothetical protein